MTIYPVSGYATAKFTVSATPGYGTHTTITAANTAASSGDTIFIRPGTYSESFTAKDGVDYVAYGPNLTTFSGDSDVIINGTVTLPNSSTGIGFQNITFQCSSGYCINDGGATGNFFEFASCSFLPSGSGAISQSGDNEMYFWNCNMAQGANSVPIFTAANGNIFIFGGSYATNGFTSATCTFAGTKLIIFGGVFGLPISASGSNTNGNLEMYNVSMEALGNQVGVTLANSRVAIISNCWIYSGNQPAVSAGAGTTANVYGNTIFSTAANALTGAGTINYGGNTFTSTSTTNATTETYAPLTGKQGGTGIANPNLTINLASGATGDVLTSDSSGNATWAANPGTGAITTIDADSGNLTGASGVITISGGTTGLTTTASSHTLDLTGTLVVANGGTAATSYNTNGAVISGTSSTAALAAVSLSSQKFLVGNSGAPTAKGLSIVIQTFTSNGTYTPTSGMVYCVIECMGGGGAGGGAPSTTAGQFSAGAGAGGGQYNFNTFSAATIGASKTVTIGAGGTANSGATGGNGGTTSVGSTLISAGGGTGGASIAASNATGGSTGGNAGQGGTGGISSYGNPGGGGYYSVIAGLIHGGFGGNSLFAAGGAEENIFGSGFAGNTGGGYGAGGGGATNAASQSAQLGGAGTAGIVIITEYVIS
jgi:hypothetical protein